MARGRLRLHAVGHFTSPWHCAIITHSALRHDGANIWSRGQSALGGSEDAMESGETILSQASYPDRMGVSQRSIQACNEYGRILSDEAAHTERHSLPMGIRIGSFHMLEADSLVDHRDGARIRR